MPVMQPTKVDPEIAAATFALHLNTLWATGRPAEKGWGRIDLGPLQSVIALPATRPDHTRDWYFVKLGAEYYDSAPPTASFVTPVDWSDAVEGTRWFPLIEARPSWFGLHNAYDYPDKSKHQLICFTFVAQYYMTDHSPTDSQKWVKGKHTLDATLNRLAEVLSPAHYRKPTG